MKKHLLNILAVLVVLSMVLVACGPTPVPTVATKPVKVVVIGKSVHPYWSNVEKGVIAAGKDLGVETVFFVPPKEDVAAQIQTMETYIAQGVTGIAIAPSDPNALEPTMKKAADAGIFVTTLDTPPIEGSVSLVYIGTNNFSAGKTGGETMAKLLPDGGKVGIGRGSDTALNALQRTDGFLEGIKANTKITALEPVNDKEDAATALQLAGSVISANPDLAGAFGVYAYNGPAWATAIKEAKLVGKVKLVCFDATTDIINGIKECVIDATVAQREYDMGYKSVQIIKLMAEKGKDAALKEMGAVDGVIDTGVDVITAATLKDYEAALDKKGIPHEWNTQGWDASKCGAAAKPPAGPVKVVVIGKSVHPYWSNVEKGVIAGGKDLGVETVFFVPPKEDVAAQIQTMETYIAQGVTGIALAPSDPNALEPTMKKAKDAGIFVTTLDTPPIEGSVSLVYIGTNNFSAGKMAGDTMVKLLPNGGKVGIGRGSDTALNALQRTDGFLEGIKANTKITALEPVNDKEDAATALQLAGSVISANPDLAGAFGVYAYNGPAWATAIKEANLVGKVKLVCFDATTDIINGIKECVIDATVAQREYDMGYKSVQIIKLMAEKGADAALSEMGAVDGVIDTGVDVISAATLKDYEAGLDKKGIPHEWNTQGWDASKCGGAPSGALPSKLVIAWIPKALNNPVFETGRDGAFKKAEELTAAGPIPVEVKYVGSVASDAAEQAQVFEDAIAAGVNAVGISCNDPTACEDPINKAVAAGIPVMTWDSDSPKSQRFTYLGVDNYQGGKAAAELLVKFMGTKGKVALLTGVPGAFNLEERIRGFKDGVAPYPDIQIVTTVYCKDDINLGVQVVEETMQANPDLNGWFFVGLWPLFADRGSMPLWEAAEKGGKLTTISFDTLPVELDFMKDGYVQGLVGQKYFGWGFDTVQMIYDYIVKGTKYESWTDSGMDLVTKCNVKEMADMWAASDFTKTLPDPYACLGGAGAFQPPKLEKLVVAWIPKALNNPVFETGRDGAFKKAEELTAAGPIPVEVKYVGSVASDAAEQAQVFEDAIAAGVNAVGISCNDPTACEDPINKAVAAGIPVMTWDSDSPKSQRFTYLGVDNYQGGKAAAELLVKLMGTKGKVALLTGVPGAFNLEERIRGFKDGVAQYPDIKIATTVYCKDDINLGVQVVEETMQANPDLNGWFFVGLWPLFADRGSMPLWEAAEKGGKLTTISFDTLPVELDFMKDGYVQGLVGQKYFGWGYDTVQMIYDYVMKGTKYESWTDSGMDIVTKCNVKEMADMWAASDFTKTLPDPYACLK